ncbi:MAG TPA: hypothetical protein VEZ40_14885 [Pyrinomonadaceae bacterium]|nr:hypothetical protein [Pyrinomonadaceae bacterium]
MKPTRTGCPRCDAPRLRAWDELAAEEREVVRRLPAAASFPIEERTARHRWCVRCWHEETGGARLEA